METGLHCYMLLCLTLNHDLELSGYATDISKRMKEGGRAHHGSPATRWVCVLCLCTPPHSLISHLDFETQSLSLSLPSPSTHSLNMP